MNAHLSMRSGCQGAAGGRRHRVALGSLLGLLLLVSAPALAWDATLAGIYERFYARFDEQDTARALQLLPVEKVMEAVQRHEALVFVDVRTRAEQAVLGLALPDVLALPMNEVFKADNLARVPTDRRIVVTCHTGARAMAVALGLRSLGFEQVFVMKGGLAELVRYLDAKTAFPESPTPATPPPPAR